MRGRSYATALIAALISSTVHATPPEIIWMNEAVFGISERHVFLNRTTRNNLGVHVPGLSDTFLVVKNAETGEDERVLPIYRSVGLLIDDKPSQTVIALDKAVNPYAVLTEYGGRLLSPIEIEISGNFPLKQDQADFVLEQVHQSKSATAAATQPYPALDVPRMFLTPQDLLTGSEYRIEDCSLSPMAPVQFHWDSAERHLAHVICERDMDPVTVIVLLPKS